MVKAPLLGDGMSRTRLHYLLIMGAIGVYLPFINVYFEQDLGLTGRQIGLLAAVAPAMTLAIAPVWGAVADARGSRLQVLRWIIAGTAGGAVLLGLPTSFWPLLLAIFSNFNRRPSSNTAMTRITPPAKGPSQRRII